MLTITNIFRRRGLKTATCNQCKAPYYLDFKNGGIKLELDKRTPHRCIAQAVEQNPINEREQKIEELALAKIDAISSIGENIAAAILQSSNTHAITELAAAIHELAEVLKTREISKDGN